MDERCLGKWADGEESNGVGEWPELPLGMVPTVWWEYQVLEGSSRGSCPTSSLSRRGPAQPPRLPVSLLVSKATLMVEAGLALISGFGLPWTVLMLLNLKAGTFLLVLREHLLDLGEGETGGL